MKLLIVVLLTIAVASAEPPRPVYNNGKYAAVAYPQVQAQYQHPVQGFQPVSAHLILPVRQQVVPQTVFGKVPQEADQPEERSERNSTTGEPNVEERTEPASEQIQLNEAGKKNEKLTALEEELNEQGVYYIYHPNGVLQRVLYSTGNDAANMAYVAQLKYQNVDPIREPIYTYDPNSFVLQQVRVGGQ